VEGLAGLHEKWDPIPTCVVNEKSSGSKGGGKAIIGHGFVVYVGRVLDSSPCVSLVLANHQIFDIQYSHRPENLHLKGQTHCSYRSASSTELTNGKIHQRQHSTVTANHLNLSNKSVLAGQRRTHLLISDVFSIQTHRWLHGKECQYLKEMILHDVPNNAIVIKVPAYSPGQVNYKGHMYLIGMNVSHMKYHREKVGII
jgi:hypothetical protein